MQGELLSIPQPTRILTGLGFVLGQGVAVAAKVLVKSSRCDMLQNREKLPGAARRGKPGIWLQTAAEAASSLLYSFVYRYTTEISALAALLNSFRAAYWFKLALVQKGHLAGHCPCAMESAWNLDKALRKQGKCCWEDLQNFTSIYSSSTTLVASVHSTQCSYKHLQIMKRWQGIGLFALKS